MKIATYLKQYPDIFSLFGLALLVRLLAAWPQQQPNYMDATYSYVNALNLAAGRGFVEDFVWNYLGNPGLPPQPSHLYWMPLTSILAGIGLVVGGVSYRAAQLPFVLLSASLAPLSYGITRILSNRRGLAWLAGLLAIFSGFYFPFWTAIDNFTPFGVAGALALLCAWKETMFRVQSSEFRVNPSTRLRMYSEPGTKNPEPGTIAWGWLFLSGAFGGLAHLARADGALLLIAIVLGLALRGGVEGTKEGKANFSSHVLRFTFYVLRFTLPLLLGYLVVMLPWFIRNWQVVGTPLPAEGSKAIWLVNYDDLFSYGREVSPRTFWAQGLGAIWQGRWWALIANLQTVIAVWGMIVLTPLALVGGWQLRKHGLVQLAGIYALLLFAAMTLVFPFPGARGGLFHSGAAVYPFVAALAGVGLDRGVDWLAARRRGWKAETAKRVFGVGLVVMAISLSGFIYYQRVLRNNAWNGADGIYPAIAAWIKTQDPAATVMIGNPPAYRYHGGGLSVVIPNEDVETMLEVARRYEVDYLVLDLNRPGPLADLYQRPISHPGVLLVQTYGGDNENKVYIFEIRQR